jgi:indole-3-glycerol phosphate synthase
MLNKIIAHKQAELAGADRTEQIAQFRRDEALARPINSLRQRIVAADDVAIIAEIKRHSPSKGDLAANLPVERTAAMYEKGGAAGISVLTDGTFFHGSTQDLRTVRAATTLPVLRKDFIIDEYQLWESRVFGADAVLLIVAALTAGRLVRLHGLARELGLETVIEVHNVEEIEVALTADPEMIGINNRDLRTFAVDVQTTRCLRPLIPGGMICLSESGITGRGDIERLREWGLDAALIGEALVTSADPALKLRELTGKHS